MSGFYVWVLDFEIVRPMGDLIARPATETWCEETSDSHVCALQMIRTSRPSLFLFPKICVSCCASRSPQAFQVNDFRSVRSSCQTLQTKGTRQRYITNTEEGHDWTERDII
jgi:hypothetical protein